MDDCKNYRMTFDLHTHTSFCVGSKTVKHAVGSVEENVRAARAKGLSMIGISNHGPGHVTYGMPLRLQGELREEIDRLSLLYPDIKILLGVEANIVNPSGVLDIRPGEFSGFDYILAGYHYGIFGEKPIQASLLLAGNFLQEKGLGGPTKLLRRINTERMIKAIHLNKPKAITHPGDKGPYDIDRVAKACEESGTWMEINNFHRDLTVESIRRAANYNVEFIIGSDAHSPKRVGCFEEALKRAFEAGLPASRIVNIEPTDKHGAEERREAIK